MRIIRHAYEIHLTEMNAPTGERVRRLLKDSAMALAREPDGRNDHEEEEKSVRMYVRARASGGAWFEPPQAARAMVISWLAPRFCRDRFQQLSLSNCRNVTVPGSRPLVQLIHDHLERGAPHCGHR